jgi:uncharacterized delta-60 repeat protein
MSNVTYNGTLIGTASIAETVLPSGLPPAFTDVSITPSSASPYEISTTDVGKRLVVNSTSGDPGINFLTANTSAIPTGSQVRIAAYGRQAYLNREFAPNTLDTAFNPNLTSGGSGARKFVQQPDGKIVFAGFFATVGGVTRENMARLNLDYTLDTFNPVPNSTVRDVFLRPDGRMLIGGDFTQVGGIAQNHLALLNADGTLNTTITYTAGAAVYAFADQSDGKVIAVGNFTTFMGAGGINYVARINANGTRDTGYNPGANALVRDVAVQSDGKAVVVGDFTSIVSTARTRIARLNADGTLDTSYAPDIPAGSVSSVVIQPDGKAIIGGTFTSVNGTTRNRIGRLNTDGTLDTGFDPDANNAVEPITLLSDGKIVIGGSFTSVGGTTRNRIARLNTDGTLDTGFDPNANNTVNGLDVLPLGSQLCVGGTFTTIGGQTRNYAARYGFVSAPSGSDTIRAPYAFAVDPLPTLPRYTVATLEKIAAGEWVVTESNVS